jgi:hypothetical protein
LKFSRRTPNAQSARKSHRLSTDSRHQNLRSLGAGPHRGDSLARRGSRLGQRGN